MKSCDSFLKDHSIIVGPLGAYNLKKTLRITVGTINENQTFINVMREFMKINI